MRKLPHITESEWMIMSQLWEEAPLTAAQLVKRVQQSKNLVGTTVKTLLRRLIAKDAVNFTVDEQNSKLYYYYPLVTENECVTEKGRHFLSIYCNDSIQKLISTFVDSTDLSNEELENLKELLERKKDSHDENP